MGGLLLLIRTGRRRRLFKERISIAVISRLVPATIISPNFRSPRTLFIQFSRVSSIEFCLFYFPWLLLDRAPTRTRARVRNRKDICTDRLDRPDCVGAGLKKTSESGMSESVDMWL